MSSFEHLDNTPQEQEHHTPAFQPEEEPVENDLDIDETVQHPRAASLKPSPFKNMSPVVMLAPAVVFVAIILGVGALAMRTLNPQSQNTQAQSSPSPLASKAPSPEPELENWNPPVADNLANATEGAYMASPKPSGSPLPSGSPSVSPSPTGPLANLYFHKVECTNADSGSDGKSLSGATFAKDAAPGNGSCLFIFQNSESVETGEIAFEMTYDGKSLKKENVGTLKKGNYPTSEFKSYTEGVVLSKDAGEHTIQIKLNPDKRFAESNHNDNIFTVKYTVSSS